MFERLKYDISNTSIPTFIPIEEGSSGVALLKATTLLAFLFDNNCLNMSYVNDVHDGRWVVYSRENNVTSVDVLNERGTNLLKCDLLVAINQSSLLQRQYGIALVRDTLEYRTAFSSEFLQNTRNWLERHPTELALLKTLFINTRPQLAV